MAAVKSKSRKTTKSSEKSKGWFTRGEKAAKAARAQIASVFKPEFWMKAGEAAKVVFLDKESFNVHVHSIQVRGRMRKYTCLRHNCPLCKINEPRLFAVYRVIDLRKFKDKEGKVSPYREKYYEVGARLQPTIARLMSKKLLYKKLAEISRDGAGTATTYQIIPLDEIGPKLKAKIRKLLTPQLDFMKDYAPKSVAELKELAIAFGGLADADGDDDDDDETETARDYLADDDDED